MAAMGDEENDDEGVSTLAEYMERVEEQELVRSLSLSLPSGISLPWWVRVGGLRVMGAFVFLCLFLISFRFSKSFEWWLTCAGLCVHVRILVTE